MKFQAERLAMARRHCPELVEGKRTALFSLSQKQGVGLEWFARELKSLDWDLLASQGTVAYLQEQGIVARDVAEIVGEPILGHRVVTLSREIHAGLLARDTDQAELDRRGIPRIDLVYVNLYPLQEEINRFGHTFESVLEKIDIGGPTLLRSAAKGERFALCKPDQLRAVVHFLKTESKWTPVQRRAVISRLASEAERLVEQYCQVSGGFRWNEASEVYLGNVLK